MSDCNDNLARLKHLAANNLHGIASYVDDTHSRTYLCIGVVKLDDPVPNWDTEAMAKGKYWRPSHE